MTDDNDTPTALPSGYRRSRHTASRHGILSEHVVLSHERRDEFEQLLSALRIEHQPDGPTEGHLVEELAGIIWRKRRVLMAEGAQINRKTFLEIHNSESARRNACYATPTEHSTLLDDNLTEVLATSDEMHSHEAEVATQSIEAIRAAVLILDRGNKRAYQQATKTLPEVTASEWQDCIDRGEREPTPASLREYLLSVALPFLYAFQRQCENAPAIRVQAMGSSLPVMETLNRYETHLDRKFERTLAMLLKLRELRGR